MMKKLVIGLFALLPTFAMAAGPSVPLMDAGNDLTDKASLQRGAKLFMNYCLGCHQMQYQRYERTFRDIGIPTEIGEAELIFDGSKVGGHILNAMEEDDAAKWFGAAPPDLTLVARVRGADWIYTYLKSFYKDDSRPFGVNNTVFPLVGMPHVLQELQGLPMPITEEVEEHGKTVTKVVGIKTDGSGEMSTDEYDQAVRDLTNFLAYVGEPSRLQSEALGIKVLGFLVILFILAFFLKKEYWRDVH
ncbi:Ammonia monooxygenase gamma subunit [Pseudoalteromonas holothuriae]|uniref:Ammonia monooxygenase gamma subunit n=1 Tax=Pseudoalteromonas holothuriae TaxID=2963714 RepID=A0A9W4R295_9GAMM|nr:MULTISPECIES: cytochrome c1 [unclassified Pseudoalteromonas]CAH9063410.1 Ammonia monooxygenase gamma subunit [Pseudoalteromonas sp. CIP111854]CAH9064950.1 Ammonia monooxygenase gamma subunit [Pseudoalteromonas sp. CIP111951]